MTWRLSLSLIVLTLTGCASSAGTGPSLARRSVETLDLREPDREAVPATPAEPALVTVLDGLRSRAQAGQDAFEKQMSRTQTAAAGSGPEGSETWIAAQQQLTALEAARAPTTSALAELDSRLANRLLAGQEDGATEIQALQAELARLAEGQQRAIDAVGARISR